MPKWTPTSSDLMEHRWQHAFGITLEGIRTAGVDLRCTVLPKLASEAVPLRLVQVGFPVREPEKLRVALEHTHRVLWIRSIRGSRWARLGQLLGFARATSDTALSATIWDVVVRLHGSLSALSAGLATVLPYASASSDHRLHSLYTLSRRDSPGIGSHG